MLSLLDGISFGWDNKIPEINACLTPRLEKKLHRLVGTWEIRQTWQRKIREIFL